MAEMWILILVYVKKVVALVREHIFLWKFIGPNTLIPVFMLRTDSVCKSWADIKWDILDISILCNGGRAV